MGKKEDEFLKKLLAAFNIEAEEHLKAMSSGLLELEKASEAKKQMSIIEVIFREAHSLKGAARSVNMAEIEAVCRSLENIFSAWETREIRPSPEQFDTLHHTIDTLGKFLASPEDERAAISEVMQQLGRLEAGESVKPPVSTRLRPEDEAPPPEKGIRPPAPEAGRPKKEEPGKPKEKEKQYPVEPAPDISTLAPPVFPSAREKPILTETIRISPAVLDSLLRQTEEMSGAKLTMEQRSVDIRDVLAMLEVWKKEWSKVYPEVLKIRKLVDKETGKQEQGQTNHQFVKLMEFLDRDLAHIKSLEGKLTALETSAERDRRSLSTMVDNLLEDMKRVLMVPCSSLLDIFPKLVRDLSRDQSKEVELSIKGSKVEIDRRIMEEIKDPLMHLVRNCIDHGIEKPQERSRRKKPLRGMVAIAVSQVKSNQIEILVSDDGPGIDLEKVKNSAVKRGIISEKDADQLDSQEALSLIFESGVSTSSIITDISGRGLGLAIVQEKVEKLGGSISVETAPGTGTSVRVLLPITLATFRGVLIQAADQVFVVPTANVERSVKIKKDEIKTVENKETISLNGRTVSLVRLDDVLEIRRKEAESESSEFVPVLVLVNTDKLIAFSVDEILNEQEVLVKSLGRQLSRVRNITGATVLGSGRVVPILNVHDLLKSAVKVAAAPRRAPVAAEEVKAKRKSILVVEDSITARMLLKNILEVAGYHVETAVDGVDAFTTLRTADFDLVVSDVDMPRMNGFGLTSKIRSDKKLAELPVVLVTALESREDREQGIDVGANAYIVKSSFDQSNLLEVIQRLI